MNEQNETYEAPGCCIGHDHVHDHGECDSETDERPPIEQEKLEEWTPAVKENPWDHIRVVCHGFSPSAEEKSAYAKRAYTQDGSAVDYIDVKLDGEFVKIWRHLKQPGFQRIRRITGGPTV